MAAIQALVEKAKPADVLKHAITYGAERPPLAQYIQRKSHG